MYDFANSAFSTTVVTLFLGPYLTIIAKAAADAQGYVHPFGIPVDARSYWSYIVSLSVILQVIFLPMVGAVADYGRRKREVLAATAYLGAVATIGMFFLKGSDYLFGGLLFVIANVAFGASEAIYNSFLPEIAPPEERDAVSSKGFAVGYIGGGVLLALNLVLFLNTAKIGMTDGLAVRISLASAGAWWAIFTIPTLVTIHNRGPARTLAAGESAVATVVRQLGHTLREVRHYPQTMTFLIAYLLYNDAVQTVITLASQFGNDELKIPVSQLTLAILMVQFVGVFRGHAVQLDRRPDQRQARGGAQPVHLDGIADLYLCRGENHGRIFHSGGIVGAVMGGSQALSRSLYAQIIPKAREAEYYSVYEVSDKGTSWLCPILFGLTMQFTHSYRLAILSLVVFFIAGMLVLLKVDIARGERDVDASQAGAV